MKSKGIIVNNYIDGRRVAHICFLASRFRSKIYLRTERGHYNLKSLLGLFIIHLEPEMLVYLEASGEDEDGALAEIEKELQ